MKKHSKKLTHGVTLLEMTIVIMVIIGLIGVLFIGFKLYREGSNRAICLVNISNAQKEIRSYAVLNKLVPGDTVLLTESTLPTAFHAKCNTGTYSNLGKVPLLEIDATYEQKVYLKCSEDKTNLNHRPSDSDIISW